MNAQETNEIQPAAKQKYLGSTGIIAFIALMNMFIPLSTDLYLPALPKMSQYFQSNPAVTNLTLSVFFIFYAAGILLWGPLSDKYGRKPILMAGNVIYILSTIACALSTNVYILIITRAIQGIGAGAVTTVSVAMVKDCFAGKKRESILAVIQSISGIAPMIAPIIGAFILTFSSWRGSFWTLAAIGILNLILTLLYQESLTEADRYKGTLLGSMGRLLVVARNRSFFYPAIIFSLLALPFMGYIAVSSYIYVDYFGLNEQVYSYFFAANALVSILGPFLYVRFFSKMNKKLLATACFAVAAVSGLLVMTIGRHSPALFLLSFVWMSLAFTATRPFSMSLLFRQQQGDTGSVSSIINTMTTVLGSIGMAVASVPWGNIVTGLGVLIVAMGLISVIGWLAFLRSSIPCVGVKDPA